MTRYHYDEQVQREIEHMARLAIPGRMRLQAVDLETDFGGTDYVFRINGICDLATRARFDRPAYAADQDISWRNTEPRKIQLGTYAPLALFVWLRKGWAVAGKLVDVYQMAQTVEPRLSERSVTWNGDGTGFVLVDIDELVRAGALLRQGDRDEWAAAVLRGNERTLRIIDKAQDA